LIFELDVFDEKVEPL
jgi:hypothetical protein